MISQMAQLHDIKIAVSLFENIRDILRSLSLVQSLFGGLNAPIWYRWEPTHMRRSRTERSGLKDENPISYSLYDVGHIIRDPYGT